MLSDTRYGCSGDALICRASTLDTTYTDETHEHFAVLAGMKDHRDELGRLVRQALTRLEQQHHALVTAQGATPPGLAEPRDAPPPSDPDKLRLSASLFRATAVLGDPALRQRALRHLSTLLYR